MPRSQYRRLRGLANNRQRLLEFVGYRSIRRFRRDNPDYTTPDAAYRDILNLYNDQIDNLREQERLEERARRQQQTIRNRYDRLLGRRITRMVDTPSNLEQTLEIDMNVLGNIRPVLNRLVGTQRRFYLRNGAQIYMLNANTIRRLEDIIDNRVDVASVEYESGREIITAITEAGDVELVLLPENIEGNQQVEGGLFLYTHNLDKVDLRRYAIYHKDTKWGDELNDNNCLITALKSAGVETGAVEHFVKNQFIPQKCLGDIASKINRYIVVKSLTGKRCLRKYGDPTKEQINIGLIEKHYFLIEPVEYTSYSINNYFEIIHKPKWNEIYKKQDGYFKRDNTRFIDSYTLIGLLLENKETHLNNLEGVEIYKMNNFKKYEEDIFKDLSYVNKIHEFRFNKKTYELEELNPDGELEKNEPKYISDKRVVLGLDYFDFETTTKRDDGIQVNNHYKDASGNLIIHKPYCVYSCETAKYGGFWGDKCGKKFLEYYCDKYGSVIENSMDIIETNDEVFVLIAHNSGYDFRFLQEHFTNINTIEKGTGLMIARCDFYMSRNVGKKKITKKLTFEIRDSLKMINMGLGKFGKAFNLGDIKKEILPYDLYTEERVKQKYINIGECLSYVKEEEHQEYLDNITKWGCWYNNKKQVDILKYSGEYCKMDCFTLKAGFEKFNALCKEAIKLDTLNYISLASMANDYLVREGCYEGVLKIAGIPRAFIQKCIVGGRTMCAENKKHIIQDGRELADFDAVSLYPSGMARMKGFLKGEPKIIKKFQPNKYDGYFICIRVKKIKIRRAFPLLSAMSDKGVRMFSNDLDGKIVYIDKMGLEDAIKYQGLEYEFINGYYYNEGHNEKIKETIQHLFRERLKYKKEGNPLQLVFKECMNSSYGKSYMKPIEADNVYVKKDDFLKFVNRHYNSIKIATPLYNGKGFKVSLMKPVDKHFNNAQVGVEILSITKRIMNEVMTLAEDLKLPIFYQDTDSIHIECKNIEKLATEYKKINGRELIGKMMGQFHTDFDLKGSVGEIKAVQSIFLGKKAYIDKLEGKDKNGNTIIDYHIRMKGVPDSSITYLANKDYDGNVMKIYEELFNGKEITFNLLAVKPKFDLARDMTISSKSKFDRKVKF